MTSAEIIRYLRLNVNIQNEDIQDEAYLSMTDDDLALYITVAMTRDYPEIPSIDLIPDEDIYPIMLLAKKELYYALASSSAPLYDLSAGGSAISREQRFQHYYSLITLTDIEYNKYIEDCKKNNTLVSYDVLLSDRYATKRNYEKGKVPLVILRVVNIADTYVEIEWSVAMSRFDHYSIYLSNEQIADEYSILNTISPDALLVATIYDNHITKYRIDGLEPSTLYHIMVSAVEKSLLTGRSEITVTTLGSI